MPKPPEFRDVQARIMADVRRQGYCLLSYEEIRAAWPGEFGTAAQAALMGMLARDCYCDHSYQEQGVVFTPQAAQPTE